MSTNNTNTNTTTTNNAAVTLETAAAHFEALGEAGAAVLYKICKPEATPADIAAALKQRLDKDGKPRSTDIRISGVSQLIQAGFLITAAVPTGGLKPVTARRSSGGSAAAITAAKAEAEAAKAEAAAEAAAAIAEAEAATLATVTAAALAVLNATNGDAAALAGMPEAAQAAALERWNAEQAEKLNAANAEAAALLAKCAEAAGVEAAALLDWIEAHKTESKKAKKA